MAREPIRLELRIFFPSSEPDRRGERPDICERSAGLYRMDKDRRAAGGIWLSPVISGFAWQLFCGSR